MNMKKSRVSRMLDELLKAAQTEVENHSIYVWGGSGQLCCEV